MKSFRNKAEKCSNVNTNEHLNLKRETIETTVHLNYCIQLKYDKKLSKSSGFEYWNGGLPGYTAEPPPPPPYNHMEELLEFKFENISNVPQICSRTLRIAPRAL